MTISGNRKKDSYIKCPAGAVKSAVGRFCWLWWPTWSKAQAKCGSFWDSFYVTTEGLWRTCSETNKSDHCPQKIRNFFYLLRLPPTSTFASWVETSSTRTRARSTDDHVSCSLPAYQIAYSSADHKGAVTMFQICSMLWAGEAWWAGGSQVRKKGQKVKWDELSPPTHTPPPASKHVCCENWRVHYALMFVKASWVSLLKDIRAKCIKSIADLPSLNASNAQRRPRQKG